MSARLSDSALRRARVATTLAYAVQGLSVALLVTRTPAIKAALGLSDTQLGLLLVAIPVVAVVGTIVAGTLAPRIGSRAVLRIAGPIVPAITVVVGFSDNLALSAAALIIFGIALGAADATMNMQATSVQHGYGRPIISSCFAWLSAASLCGALLSSAAAATAMPLGVFFLACAGVVIPLQVLAGRHLVTDVRINHSTSPGQVPWLPLVAIGLGLTCASILDSSATNWSAVFLTDQVAASDAAGALGYAAYSVCLLVGQAFVDRLNARFGAVVLIRAGSMLGLIAVIIIITAQTPDRGLLGFALLGLSVAPFLPLAFTAAAAHDPDRSGRAIARINVFSYFGILLGAPLIGAVADSFSLRVAFALLITAPVVALAVARAYRTSGV